MDYRLTQHFRERWIERVSSDVPSIEALNEMIAGADEIQRYRKALTPRGRPITFMALYWVAEPDIIIKVDAKRRQAVTVLTKNANG